MTDGPDAPPGGDTRDPIDDLELELRRLPGVRAAGFVQEEDALLVHLDLYTPPVGAEPIESMEAVRIAARHAHQAVAVELDRRVSPPPDRPERGNLVGAPQVSDTRAAYADPSGGRAAVEGRDDANDTDSRSAQAEQNSVHENELGESDGSDESEHANEEEATGDAESAVKSQDEPSAGEGETAEERAPSRLRTSPLARVWPPRPRD